MSRPHVLALPFPAQGHVIPLLALSHCLVEHGFKVTFVNTEFNHRRIMSALAAKDDGGDFHGIDMASIPDGLAPGEDRNDLGKLVDGFLRVMPKHLEEVIRERKERGDEVTWMVADQNMSWAFAVGEKMGLRRAAFWPAAAVCLGYMFMIPKLIQDGIIHADGWPREAERTFHLYPGAPPLKTALLSWNNAGNPEGQSTIFRLVSDNNRAVDLAEFVISNSFYEVERATYDHFPNMLPVGPLLTTRRPENPVGHFWSEDAACIKWLDGQDESSVVYAAFGSFTVFGQLQFQELAQGLELCGKPFLWVVRPDLTEDMGKNAWFDGFCRRVAGRGMVVEWCPQQQVLAHPSIACFVSHCGWNSTMEGVWNGLPFLCWPYFVDQFINHSYIHNVWNVGLGVEAGKGGIVTKEEVKEKLEALLGDEGIKARARALKEAARRSFAKGGSSYLNLEKIVRTMKE